MIGMEAVTALSGTLPSNVAAVFLAFVMARGALHKLKDPAFEGTLADYRLLPAALLPAAGPALIAAELAAAFALILPAARPWGAALAMALLALYAAAIAVNLLRGRREIDCGCGGPGELISWALVGRNLALIVLAAPSLYRPAIEDPAAYGLAALLATFAGVGMLCLSLILFESVAGRNAAIALRLTR